MWERCERRDEEDGEVYKEGEVFWEGEGGGHGGERRLRK